MISPSDVTRPKLGHVAGELAESLAWLNSPAAIAGEIARLEAAVEGGGETEATRVLLRDWRAIQRAQHRLVGEVAGEIEADLAAEIAG